jgi:putative transposase
MYKFRLYPSREQRERLIVSFKICKAIYNELLGLNKELLTTNRYDFNGLVLDLKLCNPEFNSVHSQVLQNVSDRVHKAFANFFRRIKEGVKEKGYPRFKSRINSITFPQSGFKLLSDKRLRLSKIGNIPIILHRVPRGEIKTLTIKQNKAGQWYAIFSCELPDIQVIHPSVEKVGVDVGLENLVTLSNGEVIGNPRHLIKAEKRLKFLQRIVSRKKKGSKNRGKAIHHLAVQHLKVANQRSDFLHKISKKLTMKYKTIVVENLSIKNMLGNHCLAKHIGDAGWNMLINMLSYKAVTCGGQIIKVSARNTSKTCSKCGMIIDMPLAKRKFICSSCGFVCHRDLNASNNILGKVRAGCPELNACGDKTSTKEIPLQVSSLKQELHTTKPSTSSVVGSSTF